MVFPAFDLSGQPQAVELLTQAIAQQRLAPAYLFAGPDGVGRARAARQFLQLIISSNAPQRRSSQDNHPDIFWVEPTYSQQGKLLTLKEMLAKEQSLPKARPQIRLEQIREIARFLSRPPLEAPRSLVVLEQAETMAEAAANGLLKTLEEPGQATLILIASSETALLPTLVSRCQRIPFYRLTTSEMAAVLSREGWSDVLQQPQILQMAQGSPGAAIAHAQKFRTLPPELLQTCLQSPTSPRVALEQARQISQALDLEMQLWLVDYLQHAFWQQRQQIPMLQILERTRQHLLHYAQPQLVWEVTCLELLGCC